MGTDHYLKTAYAYLYIRDFDAAKRAFEQAITEDPSNPEYYFHASVTALRNGEMSYAESAARQATLLEPENPLYTAHLGVVQARGLVREAKLALIEGRTEDGKALLQQAVESDPLCEVAHDLLESLDLNR